MKNMPDLPSFPWASVIPAEAGIHPLIPSFPPEHFFPMRGVLSAQAGIQSCPYLRGVVRNVPHHRWSEGHCAKSVLSRERVLEHALPTDGPLQCTKETTLGPRVHLDVRRHADHGVRFRKDGLGRVELQLE